MKIFKFYIKERSDYMEYIIIILLLITILLIYRLYYYKEKYQIYYNNYEQCLNTLKEYDPELKAYLESKQRY